MLRCVDARAFAVRVMLGGSAIFVPFVGPDNIIIWVRPSEVVAMYRSPTGACQTELRTSGGTLYVCEPIAEVRRKLEENLPAGK